MMRRDFLKNNVAIPLACAVVSGLLMLVTVKDGTVISSAALWVSVVGLTYLIMNSDDDIIKPC